VKNMGQQETGRSGPDDGDLGAHDGLLFIQSLQLANAFCCVRPCWRGASTAVFCKLFPKTYKRSVKTGP
jgi:hypothetical protein